MGAVKPISWEDVFQHREVSGVVCEFVVYLNADDVFAAFQLVVDFFKEAADVGDVGFIGAAEGEVLFY